MKEQRKHVRLSAIEIPVKWGQSQLEQTAIIEDLSEEGICLHVNQENIPEVGDAVRLGVSLVTSQNGYWIFSDPGSYVASIPREYTTYIRGEVKNIRHDKGDCFVGIQLFDEPDSDSLGLIRDYIAENS